MQIEWRLYDDEGVDALAPLGAMTLRDDEDGLIEQEATYLDAWFSALVAGVRRLRAGEDEALIHMDDQPDPLEISSHAGDVTILHGEGIVVVPLDELAAQLRTEGKRFLEKVTSFSGWQSNETIVLLGQQLDGFR